MNKNKKNPMYVHLLSVSKKTRHIIILLIAVIICIFITSVSFKDAQAVQATAKYEATIIDTAPASPLSLIPGETKDITITFKNTGTMTFYKSGATFTALNTEGALSKKSVFQHSSWPEYWRPAPVSKDVKSGETSKITFTIQAPKTEGTYTESFRLATKGTALIDKSLFSITVKVEKNTVAPTTTPTTSVTGSAHSAIITSVKPSATITLTPSEAATLETCFKNTGTSTFKKNISNFTALNTEFGTQKKSAFQHSSWSEYWRPAFITDAEVKPQQASCLKFTIQAPKNLGTYTESFRLATRNVGWIDNSLFTITVTVVTPEQKTAMMTQPTPSAPQSTTPTTGSTTTPNAPTAPTNPSVKTPSPSQVDGAVYIDNKTSQETPVQTPSSNEVPSSSTPPITQTPQDYGLLITRLPQKAEDIANGPAVNLMEQYGPRIRVGLFKTEQSISVKGVSGSVQVRDANDITVQEVPANQTITLEYVNGNYNVGTAGFMQTSPTPFRLIMPLRGVMQITSYSNITKWNGNVNDNEFRDTIELRYSTKDKTIWAINELPLEFYLRGLGETSPGSPSEYTKAMVIAARSYALYHLMTNTKHYNRNFHVTASEGDQVYLGYNLEERYTELTEIVQATRGVIATFEGNPAVVPYYSKSDGRTRTWDEVWGKTTKFTYANVSKSIPWDKDRTLYGHGVGISAYAARDMDKYHSAHALEIISYFFNGLEFKRWY
jgi:hypothetical protein